MIVARHAFGARKREIQAVFMTQPQLPPDSRVTTGGLDKVQADHAAGLGSDERPGGGKPASVRMALRYRTQAPAPDGLE